MSEKIEPIKSQNFQNLKSDWDQDDEEDNDWEDWGEEEDLFEDAPLAEDKKPELVRHVDETKNFELVNATEKTCESLENYETMLSEQKVQNVPNTSSSSSSWGSWGGKLTSVLSTASEGLGNITLSVNQGINQIIGLPDPEEMARINIAQRKNSHTSNDSIELCKEDEQEKDKSGHVNPFGLNLVSGVTNLGSIVINTGLDTLEGIGKKTMTILQENDPKLLNKRKMLGLEMEKPNLSALLQEAKKDADQIEQSLQKLQLEKNKAQLRFDMLFENFCGLVHYEALEILSKESAIKLQALTDSVSGSALIELKETVSEVKELLELENIELESEGQYESNELKELFETAIGDADINIKFDDIVDNWSKSLEWLNSSEALELDLQQAYGKSIAALSECCALEICKLHKIAELLLVKEYHSTANEVDSIAQLCKQFHAHLQGLSNRYAVVLSSKGGDEAKTSVSTLFSEMLQGAQYIEKAYKLFTPILQMGAV